MKYLFILLFPFGVYSQSYVPFISTTDSSDVWFNIASCTDFNCYTSHYTRYTIDGDTTIGAYTYAKLKIKEKVVQGADQSQWCTISTNYYEYYGGAIREVGRQIFYKPLSGPEYIAYDFNLTVGDTIPAPNNVPGDPSYRIIDSVDQVLINGNYRNRFWFGSYKYVIEGIGASTGLFNTVEYESSSCAYDMLCYSENGTPEHFIIDCNYNLGIAENAISKGEADLVKIIDYMGRETKFRPNTPLIYIYSDGSTQRVYQVE